MFFRLCVHLLSACVLLLAWPAIEPIAPRADARPPSSPAPVGQIGPEQAIAVALNELEPHGDGFYLRHPRHTATFSPDGLRFQPHHGGPEWEWQLAFVGTGAQPLGEVATGPVRPAHDLPGIVAY